MLLHLLIKAKFSPEQQICCVGEILFGIFYYYAVYSTFWTKDWTPKLLFSIS